jgi:hypothetical protein
MISTVNQMPTHAALRQLLPDIKELKLVVVWHFPVGRLEHWALQQRGNTSFARRSLGLLD